MSVAKYRAGETVYHWLSGKIIKVTITSCTIDDDEIDYVVTEQGKEKGRSFSEDQLFPTALDAAKEAERSYVQDRIDGLTEYLAGIDKIEED